MVLTRKQFMEPMASSPALPKQHGAFTRGHYLLKEDLESLQRVYGSQAHEAVAFYAGRILEVLAAQALDDLGVLAHQTVLSNLDVLEQYSLMPRTTCYFAHALRRLANDARHILRPISAADARVAFFFVDHWVEWYFHHYSFGPGLAIARDDAGAASASRSLQQMLSHFDAVTAEEWLGYLGEEGLSGTPVLPALLAESYLDRGRLEDVRPALERGLGVFPDDPRLTLLRGLYLSRHDELPEAAALLEPFLKRFANDSEASGILAGVYKRLWQKEPTSARGGAWLKRAFETYHGGWKASRETSAYLGANAATTALWLGRPEQSKVLAETVHKLIRGRMESLSAKLPDPLAAMEYWSGVTLAEVELLSGDVEGAKKIYGKLFALHPEKQGNIAVTKQQAAFIHKALGRADAFFE
jgi:tetratricopeptide (TPR) repeat protein